MQCHRTLEFPGRMSSVAVVMNDYALHMEFHTQQKAAMQRLREHVLSCVPAPGGWDWCPKFPMTERQSRATAHD